MDILIMDFAKAFNMVNHSLLVHNVHHYGIQGPVNKWIANFLSDRRQPVVVNGVHSSFLDICSGVPQGLVLGPCLFLVYTNDLPENLTALARLFANDTIVSTQQDQDKLQEDLHWLAEWEKSWDMHGLSPRKVHHLASDQEQESVAQ